METINLTKGERIDLSKVAPGTTVFGVALGWDTQKYDGGLKFDLDATAFCTKGGVSSGIKDMIGYMTPGFVTEDDIKKNPSLKPGIQNYRGFASHSGDDLTGGKPGDDEIITIDSSKVPLAEIDSIQFNATIYEAITRKQTFGQVSNSFIRVFDKETDKEICRFDLGEDFSTQTAVVAGRLYNHNGTWKFEAIGAGYNDGLAGLCKGVGLSASNG